MGFHKSGKVWTDKSTENGELYVNRVEICFAKLSTALRSTTLVACSVYAKLLTVLVRKKYLLTNNIDNLIQSVSVCIVTTSSKKGELKNK